MAEQISSYRLEGELARGGMGIVYRGVHTVFDEVVAIKAIFPELTLNTELRERFVNEAKIQRRLQHPNVVQIREFLIEQGKFYILMEFIEGETLAQRLKRLRTPMPLNDALEVFRQALAGLGFAHSHGVIHRDIKPSNILLTRDGVAKLTDFGIARAVGAGQLTRTGTVLGTPAYMSPEQIQGLKMDSRTDIYSMGVTLYEMFAGRVPFERPQDSDSDFAVLAAHINEQPPTPCRFASSIPAFVESAILKALAKQPVDRFSTCEEFQAALAQHTASVTRVAAGAPPLPVGAVRGYREAAPHAVRPTAKIQVEKPAPPKVRMAEKKSGAGIWWMVAGLAALIVGGVWLSQTRQEKSPTNITAPMRQPQLGTPETQAGPAQKTPSEIEQKSETTTSSSEVTRSAAKVVSKKQGEAGGETAASASKQALTSTPSPEEPAARVRQLLSQAKSALDSGQYDGAIGEGRLPVFTERDQRLIRSYFTDTSNLPHGLATQRDGKLPPGLERHLERDGTLLSGLQKRVEPFPAELSRQLPKLPAGYSRVILAGKAMILDRNNKILDLMALAR